MGAAGGKGRRAAVRAMGRCALAPRPPQDDGRFATLTGIFSETGVSRGVSGGDLTADGDRCAEARND